MDSSLSSSLPEDNTVAQSSSSTSPSESKPPVKHSYQKGKAKKPKRNKSAFILFSIEMRAKLKTGVQDQLNSNEMMVKLAELWKQLPKEEKEKFHAEAKSDKMRYLKELDNFSRNFPTESIHNKTKKNHIKKPCSAYAIFLKEMKKIIKKQKPELKMADVLKIVSEKWKGLTEQEKVIYQERAKLEKELVRVKLGENLLKEANKNEASKNFAAPKKKLHTQDSDGRKDDKDDIKTENLPGQSPEGTLSTATSLTRSDFSLRNDLPLLNTLVRAMSQPLAFPHIPSRAFNLFPSFLAKEQATNDDESKQLLELLNKTAKKSSELIADLLNFHLPTERFDSLNIFDRNPLLQGLAPFMSAPMAPLNDLSNLVMRNRPLHQPRTVINNIIIDALKTDGDEIQSKKEE